MATEERNERNLQDELSELTPDNCSQTFTLELDETYDDRNLFETTTTEFENILRESNADSERRIEILEQEKHSLQMKLEIYQKSEHQYENSLKEETNNLKFEHEQTISEIERNHFKEVNQLKHKKDEQAREISMKEILLEQKHEKIAELELQIAEFGKKHQTLPTTNNDSISTIEDADLKSKNEELLKKNQELQTACDTYQVELEGISLELSAMLRAKEELDMDVRHFQKEISSHHSMITDLKQQKLELAMENDALKFSSNDPNKRGNSLFAEVDDKRVEIQRQLISAQTKLKGADKKFQQQVHYTLQLKSQIVQLLASQGSQTDKVHIRELRSDLEEERKKTKENFQTISKLEEKLAQSELRYGESIKERSKSDPDFVKFLENLMAEKDRKIEKGKEELEKCKRELLSDSFRMTEYERDLHSIKRERDLLKSSKVKLELELERLKIKCGEQIGSGRSEIVGKKERIVFNPDGTLQTESNKDGRDFIFVDGVKQVYNRDGFLQTDSEEKENLCYPNTQTTEPDKPNPVTSSKTVTSTKNVTSSKKVSAARKKEVDEQLANCKQQ